MKNKKINAVIFDVDGVLLDTVPYHYEAWRKMFQDEGHDFSMDEYLLKVNGLPRLTGIQNVLAHLKNESELEALAEKKQVYYLELVGKNPPLPLNGVVELLTELKKQGYKLAAASSSKNAPLLIKMSGLHTFFDISIGGNDFKKSKPDPEIFLTAAQKLTASPENCVVVEDAQLGVVAAKKGGMRAIGLLSSNDLELKNSSDFYLDKMTNYHEILSYLTSENGRP